MLTFRGDFRVHGFDTAMEAAGEYRLSMEVKGRGQTGLRSDGDDVHTLPYLPRGVS